MRILALAVSLYLLLTGCILLPPVCDNVQRVKQEVRTDTVFPYRLDEKGDRLLAVPMMFNILYTDITSECECEYPNNLPKEAFARKFLVIRLLKRYESDYKSPYPYDPIVVDNLIKEDFEILPYIKNWECIKIK